MSPGHERSGPRQDRSCNSMVDETSTPMMTREVVVDGEPARVVCAAERPVDLVSMGRAELNIWQDGYRTGYVQGIDKGRQDGDDEAQQLFQEATRVVQFMAGVDPYEDRQRRATGGGRR